MKKLKFSITTKIYVILFIMTLVCFAVLLGSAPVIQNYQNDIQSMKHNLIQISLIMIVFFVTLLICIKKIISNRLKILASKCCEISLQTKGSLTKIETSNSDFLACGSDEITMLVKSFNKMIDKLNKSDDVVRQEIEQTLDSIEAGIIEIDGTTNQIVKVNRHAAKLIGRSKDEIIGMNAEQIFKTTTAIIQEDDNEHI